MVLTEVTTVEGQRRVYFTRVASVVSYFEEDEDGNAIAHVEFGDYVSNYCRDSAILVAMEAAMFDEAARRLAVPVDAVESKMFKDLLGICDAPLKERHSWTVRTRGVGLPRR